MTGEPGGGDLPGGKPAPLFQVREVKVGDVVRKGATGVVGDTTVSIQPNEHGTDNLEVAF